MKYSIEEKTLTDIGDALRRKHGETKTEIVKEEKQFDCIVSKTNNATGFDSFEGNYYTGTSNTIIDVVKIDNAENIKVKMSYQTVNKAYAYVQVVAGEFDKANYPTSTTTRYGGSTIVTVELEFYNTNTVTFRFYDGAANTNYLGYYAEVKGMDKNGDVLEGIVEVEREIEVPNTYSSAEMAEAIDNIEAREALPEEAFVIAGNCDYKFAFSGWDWYLDMFKGQLVSNNITSATYMFYENTLNTFPFEINFADGGCSVKYMFNAACFDSIPSIDFKQTKDHKSVSNMFDGCKVREIGTIKNLYPSDMSSMFQRCQNLRYLPEFENLNLDRIRTYAISSNTNLFNHCYSLREIPESFLKKLYCPVCTGYYYSFLYSTFNYCCSLDEVRGLNPQTGKMTSNQFNGTFNYCHRLKDIIFAMQEGGSPYVVDWSKQTLDLSILVGYANISSKNNILNFNSGITADKEVTDDASYQALKEDSDWFTCDVAYSRYNHDSAVTTINSLPNVTQGSSNIIKFKGDAGSATDGGAINTLIEEEIARASAKGWTVTFV